MLKSELPLERRKKALKCKICSRDGQENGFCKLHLKAYQNIVDKFDVWKKASCIFWSDYLVEIQKNSLTGEWAKEVVKHLIEEGTAMSSKVKKSSSSLSFSLSRWFRRISTGTPAIARNHNSRNCLFYISFLAEAYTLLLIILLPSAYYNGKFYFLIPKSSVHQFISDTLISVILYALGFVGLLMIYQSTKSAYKPRQAYMMLVIGVTLLLLSYIFLEGAISLQIKQRTVIRFFSFSHFRFTKDVF